MKPILTLIIVLSQIVYAGITEYLTTPKTFDLTNTSIFINNPDNTKPFAHDETPHIVINNFAKYTQKFIPFDNWVLDELTGLYDATEQWGFTYNAATVSSMNTSLQAKGKSVGIFLNTFKGQNSHPLITHNTATSIQYVIGWKGKESLGADLWNTRPDDDLCILLKTDIHSSYTNGAVNQAVVTLIFRTKNTHPRKNFFYNILLHDSRSTLKPMDMVMKKDGQDTTMPIVITYAHSNNETSKYSKAIPEFGSTLQGATTATLPQGSKSYGTCISRSQMDMIVRDIKNIRGDYDVSGFKTSNLRLDTFIFGPEINTNPTKIYDKYGNIINVGKRVNGYMGMKIDALWIYRSGNGTPAPTSKPKVPTRLTSNPITTDSATLHWKDNANNETGYRIYEGNRLIATLPANTTSYILKKLKANTQYHYSVKAYNVHGETNSLNIDVKTKDNYAWYVPVDYNMVY